MYVLVERHDDVVHVTEVDAAGHCGEERQLSADDIAAFVAHHEREHGPRWVWNDTRSWYSMLLDAGVTVARCHDLRLAHEILMMSPWAEFDSLWRPVSPADLAAPDVLFAMSTASVGSGNDIDELVRQLAAVECSEHADALQLLITAESAGALIAAEIGRVGLPWSVEKHDAILKEALGDTRLGEVLPERLRMLQETVRAQLDSPSLNVDSPGDLLKALRRNGIDVANTRSWVLREVDHPVVEPLLEFRKLSRLRSAHGWEWLRTYVRDGRYHPNYVVGGVVTGRWANDGGGALQLPHSIRAAVTADPGWVFVVADAAQLEPRILAGMAHDAAMAAAGDHRDLYDGITLMSGIAERAEAKVAMLAVMYGATSGNAQWLLPRLNSVFHHAISYVSRAASTGENGGVVTTMWGRGSPSPEFEREGDENRGRDRRAWGRFTRNFVVQGTAAEWSMSWMALLRNRLRVYPSTSLTCAAPAPFDTVPHSAFFLHDEIIVHAPAEHAERVRNDVIETAAAAGRLMFGGFPVTFPVSAEIVEHYGQATHGGVGGTDDTSADDE